LYETTGLLPHTALQRRNKKKIGGSNVPAQSTIHKFARKLEKNGDLNEGGKYLRQMPEAATRMWLEGWGSLSENLCQYRAINLAITTAHVT